MRDKPLAGAAKPRMLWFPFFPADWIVDTQGWPLDAMGALIQLMSYQWLHERLPFNKKRLSQIAGCHDPEAWNEIWSSYLADKFTEIEPGYLANNRLHREYIRLSKKNEQAANAAKKRWENQTSNADAHADASPNREHRIENKDKKNSPTGRVPHQSIVDLYHEHCPALPKVKVINSKRQAALRARWKTFSVEVQGKERCFNNLDTWERYFKFITNNCPFLLGQNDRSWVANFDFCIRETAMVGVFENKYVERK